MVLDISKINVSPKTRSRETDPTKIFNGLTLRGSVENLWDPQGRALRSWHEKRTASDLVIEMNTGGGKTLVGLLIAQSLVNELQGKVLYVCPTNQLVEQAAKKARECGLAIATYKESTWSEEDAFEEGLLPCVTNYAAVFNGKSIFERRLVSALVLDDAHAAGPIIRGHFTLRLLHGHEAYRPIADLFRGYFSRSQRAQSFDDAVAGKEPTLLFVPMFEVHQAANSIRQLLLNAGVTKDPKTLFAWEHLKDNLECCTVLISDRAVEIAPAVLPIHRLRCLREDLRRVYLTATLPSTAEFVRAFGVVPARVKPGGKSGEAQRLFVLAPGSDDDAQRKATGDLIEVRKACIVTPSTVAGAKWGMATLFDGGTGQAGIDSFATANGNEKIVFAARYDGIDLPGDACRVLVLDGLPCGEAFLERFVSEQLKVMPLRAAHTGGCQGSCRLKGHRHAAFCVG